MKIAYLVPEYPAVTHTFVRREIQGVERTGIPVERLSVRPSDERRLVDDADKAEARRTTSLLGDPSALLRSTVKTALRNPRKWMATAIHAVRLGSHSHAGLLRHGGYFLEACALVELARCRDFGHVHVHFGTNAAMVALLAKRMGGPDYSIMIHGPGEFDAPELLHLAEKVAESRFVTAITGFARSQTLRWAAPEHWKKVHIVRCGVDGQFLGEPVVPVPSRMRLVNIGRLGRSKAQTLLLEAASRLVQEGISFELLIIGDGELRGHLERLIVRYQLGGVVRLLGSQPGAQVRQALLESRGLVLPSFGEGLPVSIMEALALGRPVISTRIAGIPDLVVSGETGWLIPPSDVGALVTAMREMLGASSEELTEMGRRGRALVAERHDAQREAAHLAALLRGPEEIDAFARS